MQAFIHFIVERLHGPLIGMPEVAFGGAVASGCHKAVVQLIPR